MQRGSRGDTGKAGQDDENDRLIKLAEEVDNIKDDLTKLNKPAGSRGSNFLKSVDSGMPMNDSQRQTSVNDNTNIDKKMLEGSLKEIKKRVAYLEDVQPRLKEANRFDVPLQLLSSSATLEEVIKMINVLIQREKREF